MNEVLNYENPRDRQANDFVRFGAISLGSGYVALGLIVAGCADAFFYACSLAIIANAVGLLSGVIGIYKDQTNAKLGLFANTAVLIAFVLQFAAYELNPFRGWTPTW